MTCIQDYISIRPRLVAILLATFGAACCPQTTKAEPPKSERSTSVSAAAFSPDGKLVLVGFTDDIDCRWNEDPKLLCLYDASTGKVIRSWCAADGIVDQILFAANGQAVCLHRGVGHHGVVTVWDVTTGKPLRSLNLEGSSDLRSLTLSADGKIALVLGCWNSGVSNRELHVFDVASGKPLQTLASVRDGISYSVVLNKDGSAALGHDRTDGIILWNTKSGNRTREWGSSLKRGGPVAITNDDKWYATAHEDTCQVGSPYTLGVWDFATDKLVQKFDAGVALDEERPWFLQFSDDGKKLFMRDLSSQVHIYEVAKGVRLWKWRPPEKDGPRALAALSPDGSRVFFPVPPRAPVPERASPNHSVC